MDLQQCTSCVVLSIRRNARGRLSAQDHVLEETVLTGSDGDVMNDEPDRLICLPLNNLGKILYKHVSAEPLATISWNHMVTAIGQDDDKAWVDVATPESPSRLEAAYIVGLMVPTAKSDVHYLETGTFPGKKCDEQIVATNVCIASSVAEFTLPILISWIDIL